MSAIVIESRERASGAANSVTDCLSLDDSSFGMTNAPVEEPQKAPDTTPVEDPPVRRSDPPVRIPIKPSPERKPREDCPPGGVPNCERVSQP